MIRTTLDRVGVDPFDVDIQSLREWTQANENRPQSRFPFGSPCRWSRTIDYIIHCWLPAAMKERWPTLSDRLARTSPRWTGSIIPDSILKG